jgi:CheY-like chemotaxis protein
VTTPVAFLVGIGVGLVVARIVVLASRRSTPQRASASHDVNDAKTRQSDSLERAGSEAQEEQDERKQPEREVAAAWLLFLRREVDNAVAALNNRLTVLKTLAHHMQSEGGAADSRESLQKMLVELDRAVAATAALHKHVSSAAPAPLPAIPSVGVQPQTSSRAGAILIVESDDGVREVLGRLFQGLGHRVVPARDGVEGFEILQSQRVDCVISATHLSRLSGMGFYNQVEQRLPFAARRFVFICGETQQTDVREFLEQTGCPMVPKPVDVGQLVEAVNGVIAKVVHDPANRRSGAPDEPAADMPSDLATSDPVGELG